MAEKEHRNQHEPGFPGSEFLGSATVGERGQIVIPAEARQKLDISPGDKLVFFSGFRGGQSLMVMKSEQVSEFVSGAIARLSKLEEITRGEKE